MHTSTTVHLSASARVEGKIHTDSNGKRYLALSITDDGAYPYIALLPAGPEFLDKLANECERVVREFVGDVPAPSQAHLDEKGERQTAEVAG